MTKNVVKRAEHTSLDPKTVLEEVLAHLRTAADSAGDRADEALEDATHAIARAADALAKETRKQSRKAVRKAGRSIKKHPVATTAIATAAVALVGLLVAHNANGRGDQ